MAVVQRISSVSEIPSGRQHVLVETGDKSELVRRGDNLVFTVDRTMPDNLFEAHTERVISDAQLLADQERVDTVFVCVPPRPEQLPAPEHARDDPARSQHRREGFTRADVHR